MFPIVEGKEKRNGKCVWPTISIFLGISRLISLHGAEGLTWTLDSFPLSPSLSNHSCLIFFALSQLPFTHLRCLNLHQFISFYRCISLPSLQKSRARVSVFRVFSSVCETCLLLNIEHKSLTSVQPLSKAL